MADSGTVVICLGDFVLSRTGGWLSWLPLSWSIFWILWGCPALEVWYLSHNSCGKKQMKYSIPGHVLHPSFHSTWKRLVSQLAPLVRTTDDSRTALSFFSWQILRVHALFWIIGPLLLSVPSIFPDEKSMMTSLTGNMWQDLRLDSVKPFSIGVEIRK